MGLEISKALGVGAIQPNFNINGNKFNTSFRNNPAADKFECRSSIKYTTQTAIEKMVATNPKIKQIVKDFNPDMNLNINELNKLLKTHAVDTQTIAKGIYENLPFSLRYKVNTTAIDEAAFLHDIGKVLIPSEVLNKPGKLNNIEEQIMHKHSELSYELLKNAGINETTLNLIRNHHQNPKKTGYPWVSNDFNADLNLQILSAADKYSALTENRVYKKAMPAERALTIIYQDVKEGKLHPFVFKALVNYQKNLPAEKISAC